MSNVMRLLWSGKWTVFTPAGFVFAVWKHMPFFRCYQQQDAQELFTSLMDVLNEELTRGGMPKTGTASGYIGPCEGKVLPLFPPLTPAVPVSPIPVATLKQSSAPAVDWPRVATFRGSDTSGAVTLGSVMGGATVTMVPPDSGIPPPPPPIRPRKRPAAEAVVQSAAAIPPLTQSQAPVDTPVEPAAPAASKKRGRPAKATPEPKPSAKAVKGKSKAAAPRLKRARSASGPAEDPPAMSLLPRFKPSTFVKDTVFGETQTTLTCTVCKCEPLSLPLSIPVIVLPLPRVCFPGTLPLVWSNSLVCPSI